MDDLQCHGKVVDQTLRELEFINTWLGGNKVTLNGVAELLRSSPAKKNVTIADLGCGGGDILRLIHRWAKRNNIPVKLVGIDANPHIIEFARNNIRDIPEIEFLAMDIFSSEFREQKFDIVTGTLFYHHFSQEELVSFLRQLKDQVQLGIVINDIHRHPLAFYSIKLLTKLFSKSAMVKYDAPLSVMRAFTRSEINNMLRDAGIEKFVLRWCWAFRWQVVIPTK